MALRVNSELLLVGSLPADSADQALRAAAGFFGDLVFALPDGETGPRSAWVGYERAAVPPAQRGPQLLPPSGRPGAGRRPGLPGHRAADRRGPGLRRRHATASRYLSDFGVAMYCGFGRQPGTDGTQTMREYARVVRAVRKTS
jgi:hypothetical protein